MHTTHPKRVFGVEHMNSTLKELELTPSSTILVLPVLNLFLILLIHFAYLKLYFKFTVT